MSGRLRALVGLNEYHQARVVSSAREQMHQTLSETEIDEWPAGSAANVAANVHVLDLAPIKDRAGKRWPRLSHLVHKTVNTALQKAQSAPHDHFEMVGELSYVATFHSLSRDEADAVLAGIHRTVCEKLFGAPPTEATTAPSPTPPESEGSRVTITAPRKSFKPQPKSLNWKSQPPDGWISHCQALGDDAGVAFRYSPVWELQTARSRLLALHVNGHLGRRSLGAMLAQDSSHAVEDVEIALLFMTASFARRLAASRQIASLMTDVSHDTLARRESRLNYLRALRELELPISCPLLLRIDRIPAGEVGTIERHAGSAQCARGAELPGCARAASLRFQAGRGRHRHGAAAQLRRGFGGAAGTRNLSPRPGSAMYSLPARIGQQSPFGNRPGDGGQIRYRADAGEGLRTHRAGRNSSIPARGADVFLIPPGRQFQPKRRTRALAPRRLTSTAAITIARIRTTILV